MADYQKMYLTLFHAMTDAVESMQQFNFGAAREILIRAEQEAEEIYMDTEE